LAAAAAASAEPPSPAGGLPHRAAEDAESASPAPGAARTPTAPGSTPRGGGGGWEGSGEGRRRRRREATLTFARATAANILGWEQLASDAGPGPDRPGPGGGGGDGDGGAGRVGAGARGGAGRGGLEGKVLVLDSCVPVATARRLVQAGAEAVVMPAGEAGSGPEAAAEEEERGRRLRDMYLAMTLGHSPAMAVAAANRGRLDPVFTCLY
jgi:hypothetical protein